MTHLPTGALEQYALDHVRVEQQSPTGLQVRHSAGFGFGTEPGNRHMKQAGCNPERTQSWCVVAHANENTTAGPELISG
jgi:hypothetical protein